ncbi:hypothetical protein [Horticoccus sp. 23ND18S-11]|uniref:hypothetical protein n=1 Tax=Horticoccus sp. 23ND18S-11 TaxID=3391832 RepID=UPI0039C9707A
MKIKLLRTARPALSLVIGLALSSALHLHAAPLTATTAVHTKPEAASPAISYLKAGTDPVPATSGLAPAGWMAIELNGPFECYVENKELTKSLDPKPGVALRLAPRADAGVLAIAERGDNAKITGLRGKWTQLSLEKKIVGYIQVNAPVAQAPAPKPVPAAAPAPMSPAPASPGVYGSAVAGQAAPMLNLGDGGVSVLPRQFAGRFVATKRAFAPRRPYDYALNDDAGKRYAYIDISKLLLTEQIEKYIDHNVVVFGGAKPVPDSKDIVIMVESLQLK